MGLLKKILYLIKNRGNAEVALWSYGGVKACSAVAIYDKNDGKIIHLRKTKYDAMEVIKENRWLRANTHMAWVKVMPTDKYKFINGKYFGEDSPVDRERNGWMDISSAPKDGSPVMGFESGYGQNITWWDEDHDLGRGGWRMAHHGWRPTKWQELSGDPE